MAKGSRERPSGIPFEGKPLHRHDPEMTEPCNSSEVPRTRGAKERAGYDEDSVHTPGGDLPV